MCDGWPDADDVFADIMGNNPYLPEPPHTCISRRQIADLRLVLPNDIRFRCAWQYGQTVEEMASTVFVWAGTVSDVTDTTVSVLCLPGSEQTENDEGGRYPFPPDLVDGRLPEVLWFCLYRRPARPPTQKRARTELDALIPLAQVIATVVTKTMIDSKANKATCDIVGGDGLRMPVSIPKWLKALYPPMYINEVSAKPASLVDIQKRWTADFMKLREHYAVMFRPGQIEVVFSTAVTNACNSLTAPAPTTKEEWLCTWQNVLLALGSVIIVAYGRVTASRLTAKYADIQSGKESLIDFEVFLASSIKQEDEEVGKTTTSTLKTTPPGQSTLESRSRCAELTAENNALRQALKNQQAQPTESQPTRGRGRGGASYRGRGGGGAYAL